eukprot:scaffold657_cov245-Pinguiococcus_pyrenoidosus.AAC.7
MSPFEVHLASASQQAAPRAISPPCCPLESMERCLSLTMAARRISILETTSGSWTFASQSACVRAPRDGRAPRLTGRGLFTIQGSQHHHWQGLPKRPLQGATWRLSGQDGASSSAPDPGDPGLDRASCAAARHPNQRHAGRCARLLSHRGTPVARPACPSASTSSLLTHVRPPKVGGTVGDIESMVFLEALRQFQFRVGMDNFCLVHVSLVPVIGSVGEQKTKPTQRKAKLRYDSVVAHALTLCLLRCFAFPQME